MVAKRDEAAKQTQGWWNTHRFATILIVFGVVLAVGVATQVLRVLFAIKAPPKEDPYFTVIGNIAVTLVQGAVIGGLGLLASWRIKDLQEARERRNRKDEADLEAERRNTEASRLEKLRLHEAGLAAAHASHTARTQALTQLTKSYWAVKKSLSIIIADRSAKSYQEQMREIVDHRLALQQLDNDISAGMYALKDAHAIGQELAKIDAQLASLIDEWTKQFLRLSYSEAQDEKKPPEGKEVPHEIEKLVALNSVVANRFEVIHTPFEGAANNIRRQVAPIAAQV
jgi:hypothetical protein